MFDCSDAQNLVIYYTETASGLSKSLEFSRDSLMLQDTLAPNP